MNRSLNLSQNHKVSKSLDLKNNSQGNIEKANDYLDLLNILKSSNQTSIKKKRQEILQTEIKSPILKQTFDEYSNEINSLMKGYKLDGDVKQNEKELKEIDVSSREKLKKLLGQFNIKELEVSRIHVNCDQTEYLNPLNSLSTLKSNKDIYEKILENSHKRQKSLFNELAKDLIVQPITNLKRIKITNTIPKHDIFQLKNEIIQTQTYHDLLVTNGKVELFGYYFYPKSNFPEGREQFSLIYNGYNNVFLFGGLSTKGYNDCWALDPINVAWNKIDYDPSQVNPRYGHTAEINQRKLILFGGKTKLQHYSFHGDIEVLNLDDRTWTYHGSLSKNVVKSRRNHVSQIIGNQILIHGGFAEDNTILNDFHLLNLNPLKWTNFHLFDNSSSPFLAGHASEKIFSSDLRNSQKINVYKFPEEKIARRNHQKIKEKGIYIFGGKKSELEFSNDLYVVKLGKKPCDVVKLEPTGKPPCPRFLHSMSFYEEGNYAIVYGGRNNNEDNSTLNDIFLLELSRLEWIEVSIYSDSKLNIFSRCGHSSVIHGNKMIVFGGVNNDNYIGSSLFVIELDSGFYHPEDLLRKKKIELMNNFPKYSNRHKNVNNRKFIVNCNQSLPPIK